MLNKKEKKGSIQYLNLSVTNFDQIYDHYVLTEKLPKSKNSTEI